MKKMCSLDVNIKSNKKKILVDSEDDLICKILEILFKDQGWVLFRTKVNAVLDTDNVIPDLIIYDIPSSSKRNDFACAPIKENSLYDKVPRTIFSTYPIDHTKCKEFKEGRCIHFQKPFKISRVLAKVKEQFNSLEGRCKEISYQGKGDKYFRVIMECGHMDASKSSEKLHYLKSRNTTELFDDLKKQPGLKSKGSTRHISMVKQISKQAYELGKVLEWKKEYIKGNTG